MSNTFKFAIALVATLGAASTASAASFIYAEGSQVGAHTLELDTVKSDQAGYVEVRELIAGTAGDIIGTYAVHAGASSDIRVQLDTQPTQGVVVELFHNGSSVAVDDVTVDFN